MIVGVDDGLEPMLTCFSKVLIVRNLVYALRTPELVPPGMLLSHSKDA